MNNEIININFSDLISEIVHQKTIIASTSGEEKELAIIKLRELEAKLNATTNQVKYLTQEVFDLKNKVTVLENKTNNLEQNQNVQKTVNNQVKKSIQNLNRSVSKEVEDIETKNCVNLVGFFFNIEKEIIGDKVSYKIISEKTEEEMKKQKEEIDYAFYTKRGSALHRFWIFNFCLLIMFWIAHIYNTSVHNSSFNLLAIAILTFGAHFMYYNKEKNLEKVEKMNIKLGFMKNNPIRIHQITKVFGKEIPSRINKTMWPLDLWIFTNNYMEVKKELVRILK